MQAAPTPPDLLVHQANPGGRYSQSRRTDATATVGSGTKITHATEFSGDTLWIGNDLTLLLTVRWGVRNVAGNTVGLGPYAPVTVAIDLPRAVTYLAPAQAVAQLAAWFQGMPGIPAPTLNPLDVPLPDRYARTRQLGKATVMSVTQLDDTTNRRERRDRMRHELTTLVENEAPGVTRPGHASHLPGVATEVARITEPAALRGLPGRGPGGKARFYFLHVAYGGARLVEVSLTAEPMLQTPALRGLRGRRAGAGTGLEHVDTHTPQSRATTTGTTTTRQGTVNPVSRYPRPGATGWTDRAGPSWRRPRPGPVRPAPKWRRRTASGPGRAASPTSPSTTASPPPSAPRPCGSGPPTSPAPSSRPACSTCPAWKETWRSRSARGSAA
ncbi:hypothetical protein ID875_00560 [Streptomyces globisporus]|uniref:Uncharacterized protein n=1 Tax=Streptomyces globisporus TaxID=1908 RepID=A0A927BGS5_STRGL|nr:hypothetical protein [Streptomyces globisporus]